MLKLIFSLISLAVTIVTGVTVEPALRAILKTNGSFNIIINLANGTEPILSQFNNRDFSTREERLNSVAAALEDHATLTQAPVLKVLHSLSAAAPGLKIRPFWISNQISVRGAQSEHINELIFNCAKDIGEIQLEKIRKKTVTDITEKDLTCDPPPTDFPWGISRIEAQDAWYLTGGKNGAGVIVATVDSGVLYTHSTLCSQYRTDGYGWYDPVLHTSFPNDLDGIGTLAMGIIVGCPYIGIAPNALWMSCQGCRGQGCYDADLLACGQWIMCPTHFDNTGCDCSKAPHLVYSNWNDFVENSFYLAVVNAWEAVGIIPIFPVEGGGPTCGTVGSPASYANVIGVGATVDDNSLATFSSRGPAASNPNVVKPDVTTPGQHIMSAFFTGDNCYRNATGTGMAGPHAAGLVALMLSERPGMDFTAVRRALMNGCTNDNLVTAGLQPCPAGGSNDVYPNNNFGQGLINARRSIWIVQGPP